MHNTVHCMEYHSCFFSRVIIRVGKSGIFMAVITLTVDYWEKLPPYYVNFYYSVIILIFY